MTEKEALLKLQNICSRQEKCVFDVSMKLVEWKINDLQSESIIKNLVAGRFIDEVRYAKSFVNDKFRFNKWGKIKIGYALKQKKVDKKIIEQALEEIDEDDYRESLVDLLKKKKKVLKDKDVNIIRHKLIRFAQSKGFGYEEVIVSVQSVFKEN